MNSSTCSCLFKVEAPSEGRDDTSTQNEGEDEKMKRILAIVILASVLLPLLVSAAAPVYDPMYDVNGDGTIEMRDIRAVASRFGATTVPLPAPPNFVNVIQGHQYWMTGGDEANHAYKGADSYCISAVPGAPPWWGPTFAVGLNHTDDWVIYHFLLELPEPVIAINLTLRNLKTPPEGTPVSVWVWAGQGMPATPHDVDFIQWMPGWMPVFAVNIVPPGTWTAYYFPIPGPGPAPTPDYYVAVHLDNGDAGSAAGTDRYVEIGWIKLYPP